MSYRLTRALSYTLLYLVLIVGAVLILLPLVWAAVSSLKPNNQIFVIPMEWLPREFRWDNYIKPFRDLSFGRYFLNSLFTATCVTLATLVLATFAGFSLAKYHFWGKNAFFVAILATIMLPIQVLIVPLYLVMRDFGWLNTYQGLIIPQALSAFAIFLMRQHLLSLPNDYLDAARIDGCSEVGLVWRVVVPMSRSALAAIAIFTFLGNWDSFIWPLIVTTKKELRTLPIGISMLFSEYQGDYAQALAVALLMMAPVLIIFILMQRQFVEGLSRTGLRS
jgi:multiple sugar transport system permease protein